MGTEYLLFKHKQTELLLQEHSNKLDLVLYNCENEKRTATIYDIEPEEAIKIALEMIKVASYYLDSDNGLRLKALQQAIAGNTYFY
jgi:hypothetical protein